MNWKLSEVAISSRCFWQATPSGVSHPKRRIRPAGSNAIEMIETFEMFEMFEMIEMSEMSGVFEMFEPFEM